MNGEGDDRFRRLKKRRLFRINIVFLWKKYKESGLEVIIKLIN